MNKSRPYSKLLEVLKRPSCPICTLVLEDSRSYLETVFYESVLDVPTRMRLMESFGLCSWHTRQVSVLPAACAPNVGFAIFASDLLRKLEFVGRENSANRVRRRKWLSWFSGKRRSMIGLLKATSCPACKHLTEFELFHLNDFMEAFGDAEFFAAYQTAQGICLPHFMMLDESHSSHRNFSGFFEMQIAKAKALRSTLEEFIRKQDFRLSGEITEEEAKAWQGALEIFGGATGIFTNEMAHDLSERARSEGKSPAQPLPILSEVSTEGKNEFLVSLDFASHVSLYLRKPIPERLFQSLKRLATAAPKDAVEVIVEDLPDVGYLKSLHDAHFSVFYGVGLSPLTTILIDRKKGFQLDTDGSDASWRLTPLKNGEDLSLTMVWHKFGLAVSLRGIVRERDCSKALFCITTDGERPQWCRLTNPISKQLPEIGDEVDIFGWEKWYSRIIEVLELLPSSRAQQRNQHAALFR